MIKTLLWDLRSCGKFVRALIRRKRTEPGEDILTALIHAEEEGDRLSEDELVAMVFLLVLAGFETTTHLNFNFICEKRIYVQVGRSSMCGNKGACHGGGTSACICNG